mmetsp:Transcript_33690/g.77789  ORF Transcript_33690/g.77789 Transcript_33690/m.77789 type:complete len:258 (+) Transcript_33690:70-843(+)
MPQPRTSWVKPYCVIFLSWLHMAKSISAPTSCEILTSNFAVSNVGLESISVTSTNQKLAFDLQVSFTASCTSPTEQTSWSSQTAVRRMEVKGIDRTVKGTTYHGIEVTDTQDNEDISYGAGWADQPCLSEEFKGTWTTGDTQCDSTSGTISGSDCIDLFRAVEASICWTFASPKVCVDTMSVSGTLSAYANLRLVAASTTVSSEPTQIVDMSGYYSCSGDHVDVTQDSTSGVLSSSRFGTSAVLLAGVLSAISLFRM